MRFSRNWIAAYTDLPENPPVFTEALSMLGLVVDDAREAAGDLILDLDLPSNRPDVLNHLEIARELAVAADGSLRVPAVEFPATGPDTAEVAAVQIQDPQGCSRFVARAVLEVAVGPSPAWICERLEAIGLRPINNVVDVTNFVMWELGRPMHAYDLDRLAGATLVVRRAVPGETVRTLDEIERQLSAEDLVIADAERPVGLAGVMGGAETGVVEGTTRVLLECACFDAGVIRRVARRHSMHTDASHRFERGMSHQGIDEAVERACGLIAEMGAGRVSRAGIDAHGSTPEPLVLDLRRQRLQSYLGIEVPADEVERILRGLGFGLDVAATAGNGAADDDSSAPADGDYRVLVPPARQDVTREVDLIEEIARFHGYDRLPCTLPVLRRADRSGTQPVLDRERHLRQVATALGFWEAITFAFTSEAEQRPFLGPEAGLVTLDNPLSEAMAVLRRHLLPGLCGSLARNLKHGEDRVRLFEVGRAFGVADTGGAVERRHLALALCGPRHPRHFAGGAEPAGMADLKGALQVLARRMGWPAMSWAPTEPPGLQTGAAAQLSVGNAEIGFAGKLSTAAAAELGLETDVWVAEIDIDDLLQAVPPTIAVTPLPRFPSSTRDVSLLLPPATEWAQVETTIAGLEALPLAHFELLDSYAGQQEDQRILTIRLTYRRADRTLTAEEIESAHQTVVTHLETDLGLQRR